MIPMLNKKSLCTEKDIEFFHVCMFYTTVLGDSTLA